LRAYQFVNSEYFVNDLLDQGKEVLAEGAQGSMLDIDFGSYPYVTSSNTVAGGLTVGLGIAPTRVNKAMGIFKAYCTRVGGGPFPTELYDQLGQDLRDKGHEYGATTGRPRRCGWLDLVALRYAIMLSGVDELIMMKSDVLSGFEQVAVGTAYRLENGSTIDQVPFEVCSEEITSEYTNHKGWNEDLTTLKSETEFPQNFKAYIDWLEGELNKKIKIISVGPDRSQTIIR
jgi:adenylosuccinate synthase